MSEHTHARDIIKSREIQRDFDSGQPYSAVLYSIISRVSTTECSSAWSRHSRSNKASWADARAETRNAPRLAILSTAHAVSNREASILQNHPAIDRYAPDRQNMRWRLPLPQPLCRAALLKDVQFIGALCGTACVLLALSGSLH
jgi:hypothetical protein